MKPLEFLKNFPFSFIVLYLVLATCSKISTDDRLHDNVVLTAAKSGAKLDSIQHNQQWKRPAGVTTTLAFGGKSRYLCIGDASGAVCLWDLKKRLRVRQFFHDGYRSIQASLDPADKFVLSLSEKLFSIYNLREGTLYKAIPPPRNVTFTKYAVSPMEPNIAAIGTADGSILLYDLTNRASSKPLFTLENRHTKAVTGIAISPINPNLLASASADGTLKFFDKQTGETIHQLAQVSNPITCLSFHGDGVSCAIGTAAGEVIMYDLRENMPLNTLRLRSLITSIQFAPPPRNRDQRSVQDSPVSGKKDSTFQGRTEEASNAESRNPSEMRDAQPSSSTKKSTSPQKSLVTPGPGVSGTNQTFLNTNAGSVGTYDTPQAMQLKSLEAQSSMGVQVPVAQRNEEKIGERSVQTVSTLVPCLFSLLF